MTTAEDEEAIVRCSTTKGPIVMKFHRRWSPHGYDRAVSLFEQGFYDHSHFFRVVKDFLVQFGISYTTNPALKNKADETIPDDPQLDPPIRFEIGTVSYAGSGENSRSSQLFIAYTPAESFGEELWETPIGQVVEGMEHVQAFYSYGDMPPWGKGPVQGKIHSGRTYIDENFPLTDSFDICKVERISEEDRLKHRLPPKRIEERHLSGRDHHQTATRSTNAEMAADIKLIVGAVVLLAGIWAAAKVMLSRKRRAASNKKS